MKIQDILQSEQNNNNSVILHKEGIFWRAYERSAYLFTLYIKVFQITKKFYKNVNSEVVYLGFPSNSLDSILTIVGNKSVSKQEKIITIKDFTREYKYVLEQDTKLGRFKILKSKIRNVG